MLKGISSLFAILLVLIIVGIGTSGYILVKQTSTTTTSSTTSTTTIPGRTCSSTLDCFDLNPITKDICDETTHSCSNKIVPCISGDNFCPLNCNDWELDSDCGGVPKTWDMVASNNPEDYLGDNIYGIKPSDWKHYQPMIDKVNELTQGLTNDYDKARNIANWVKSSRSYLSEGASVANKYGSVIDIFNEDKGVCLDAAILTTAMLRLTRIPSRAVSPAVSFMHEYTEAYVNNEWIGIDATFGSDNATIIENLSAITITTGHVYDTQDILELPEDTVREVTKFKAEITKKEFPAKYGYVLYPSTSKFIFYNYENVSNYSLIYKKGYEGFTNLGCGIEIGEYDCDYYSCHNKSLCPSIGLGEICPNDCDRICKCGTGNTYQYCSKGSYCCWSNEMNSWTCGGSNCTESGPIINTTTAIEYEPTWSVGFFFSGTSDSHGGFWSNSESKNGYLKIAYPIGKYKLVCSYGSKQIAYKEFEIIEDSEIKITLESLIKSPEASDELFNLLIQYLTKSTRGL